MYDDLSNSSVESMESIVYEQSNTNYDGPLESKIVLDNEGFAGSVLQDNEGFAGSVLQDNDENLIDNAKNLNKKENFYDNRIADILFKEYGDRKKLLNAIIRTYKFIKSEEKKQTWEKTEEEVLNDIMNTSYSLNMDNILENSKKNISELESYNELIGKKIEAFNVLTDFCYIYYIQEYSHDSPFHRLPMNLLKFNMIASFLKIKEDDTSAVLRQIIQNGFLTDLRREPPFMLRTELSAENIQEKINLLVKPICKELVNSVLKLKSNKK